MFTLSFQHPTERDKDLGVSVKLIRLIHQSFDKNMKWLSNAAKNKYGSMLIGLIRPDLI